VARLYGKLEWEREGADQPQTTQATILTIPSVRRNIHFTCDCAARTLLHAQLQIGPDETPSDYAPKCPFCLVRMIPGAEVRR